MSKIGNFSLAIRNGGDIDCAKFSSHCSLSGGNYDASASAVPARQLAVFRNERVARASPVKKTENYDEERVGTRGPKQGRISVRARARACRGWARRTDLLTGRGHLAAAKVHGRCHFTCWLAAA